MGVASVTSSFCRCGSSGAALLALWPIPGRL